RIRVSLAGASGASIKGGQGARVDGIVDVTPGVELGVTVGCAGRDRDGGRGYGHGGRGGTSDARYNAGGGGGGASGVELLPQSRSDLLGTVRRPVAVAGGGGGFGGAGAFTKDK